MEMRSFCTVVLCMMILATPVGCGKRPPESSQPMQTQTAVAAQETVSPQAAVPDEAVRNRIAASWGKLPLTFVENKGQLDPAVLFYINGPRGTVFFTKAAVVFSLFEKRSRSDTEREPGAPAMREQDRPPQADTGAMPETEGEPKAAAEPTPSVRGVVVRQSFVDPNAQVIVEGAEELEGKVNIFRGSDQSKWLTGIRTFKQVIYRDLWPKIDLVYRGEDGQLKYEFVVHTGGVPAQIRWVYEGLSGAPLIEDGALVLQTALGSIREAKPVCSQEIEGTRREVPGAFKLLDGGLCGFALGDYDAAQTLLIDPHIEFVSLP